MNHWNGKLMVGEKRISIFLFAINSARYVFALYEYIDDEQSAPDNPIFNELIYERVSTPLSRIFLSIFDGTPSPPCVNRRLSVNMNFPLYQSI